MPADGTPVWWRVLWVFAIPVVVLGGFWYVRIWAQYGSPVYPFAVNIGPVNVFDGPAKASQYMTHPPAQLGGSAIVQPLCLVARRRSCCTPTNTPTTSAWAASVQSGLPSQLPLCAALTWVARRPDNRLRYLLLVFVPVVGFVVQPYHWWTHSRWH